MAQRMKKDCLGCRAMGKSSCMLDYKCGYWQGILKPFEICPKPRTKAQFVALHGERRAARWPNV